MTGMWAVVTADPEDGFGIAVGSQPTVSSDDSGNLVVVWQGPRGEIASQGFDAVGAPRSGQFLVGEVAGSSEPDVTLLPSGEFVVTWQHDDDEDGVPAISGRRYRGFSAPRHGPGVFSFPVGIDFLIAAGREPAIAADGEGNLVVAWTAPALPASAAGAASQARSRNYLHYVRRFEARGFPVGIDLELGRRGPATAPALAVRRDGEFMVAWEDHARDISAATFDRSGHLTESFKVNVTRRGAQTSPAVTADLDDGYTAIWETSDPTTGERWITGRRISARGFPVGIDFRVSTLPSAGATQPALAADRQGRGIASWSHRDPHTGLREIRGRQVDLRGFPVGIDFRISRPNAFSPQLVPGGGATDFVVVWEGRDHTEEADSVVFGRLLRLPVGE